MDLYGQYVGIKGTSMNTQARLFHMKRRSEPGFSLLEMTIALAVLSIAMIGGLAMVAVGIGRNTATRMDTTAANVAQTILEDIASEPAVGGQNPLTITDCTGNVLSISTTASVVGGSPLLQVADPLQPGSNPGDIDFSVAPVPNYSATYVMCAPNGGQISFDVRWNIQPVAPPPAGGTPTWAKLVTVAARQPFTTSGRAIYYSPPATLRTVTGL